MQSPVFGLDSHIETSLEAGTGWTWDGLPPKQSFEPENATLSPFRGIERVDEMSGKDGGGLSLNVVGTWPRDWDFGDLRVSGIRGII